MKTDKTIDQQVDELRERVSKLELILSTSNPNTVVKNKKQSPREFLKTKSAEKVTDKALALAYFLEHIEGMSSFNIENLESIFRASKENRPKNMNDIVNNNIAKGYLDEAKEKKDGKKAWYLTITGENFVENDLNRLI